LSIVVDVKPLGTLPKKGSAKRIRNEICLSTERSEGELFHFPLCAGFFREPEGQRLGVAFLCFLSLAKQRKGVARRGQSRLVSTKRKPYCITEAQTAPHRKNTSRKNLKSSTDTPS
jgi:hypothetical protein